MNERCGASSNSPPSGTKECPYCAETIKLKAVKCRYCGSNLPADHIPKKRPIRYAQSYDGKGSSGSDALPQANTKQVRQPEAAPAQALSVSEGDNLEGIGGWLVLLGFGLLVTPVRVLVFLISTYPQIWSTGAWEVLTSPGSQYYNQLLAPYLISEIAINCGLLVAYVYLLYLFFARKRLFPKLYIGLALFSLVFIVADALASKIVFPDMPTFDAETSREVIRSLLVVLVWVPYMLVSKRVKATFTRE